MSDFTVFYRFQASTEAFERSLSRIDNSMKRFSASLRTAQEASNSLANSSLSAFKSIAVAVGASSIPIVGFQREMNRMVAASGKSHEAMAPLITLTRELGKTTEHSASAAMRGATNLVQAGFSQQQALKLLPQSLQLATAGMLSMSEATAMVSDAVKSFGLEADQSQRIVDVLSKGATMAKLQVSEFSTVLGRVGSIAQLQNQSFERTIAMFMAIKDAGLTAEISATGLGSIMQRLSKPTAEARKAFNELGIDINSMIARGAQFDDIMQRLSSKQLNTAQAAKIFGLVQAKTGAVLVQNYDKVNRYTDGLLSSNGAAKKMRDTINVGIIGAMARFRSVLEGVLVRVVYSCEVLL